MAGGAWFRPYESARLRSQAAIWLLAANVVGILLLIAFDIVDAIYSQNATPSGSLTLIDGLSAAAGVLAFYGTLIAAIVSFCMWVHRIVRNMPSLGSPDLRWSPRRAVVYCFVPVLNLLHPYYSVLDAWRGSDPARRWADAATRKRTRSSPALAAWWVCWLLGGLLSRIAFRINGASGDMVDLASNVVLIAAAGLAILVVRDVTARQDLKYHLIATGQLA
jgi:hypothetical protein